ncbi:1,4-alpha-glucan branching enzyme [Geomonas sp. Red276]
MTPKASMTKDHPGMGAIPDAGGVAFRVWAPHANKVFLVGSFNDWNEVSTPLSSEKNGYWSAYLSGAKAGDEYRYLIHGPAGPVSRIDPYARKVTNAKGNAIVYDPQAFDWGPDTFKMAPWNELVVYEMHVGTFLVIEKGQPGTLDSVIEKLPYLTKLGVNALEVMPVMEFSGDFSWGYNPSHPFAVESVYGGPDALKRLVKAAHEQGIAIIIDVVYNHFGPSDLDLWQFDGWSENEKGGIYFYNDRRSTTPWGDTRPDYGRDEVRQYLRDHALMWLEEYHADGLRWDAVTYIKNIEGNDSNPANDIPEGWSLMQWINEEIQSRCPGKISIAEDLKNNTWVNIDVGAGGAGFSAQWDSDFVHPIRQAVISRDDALRDTGAVCRAIEHRFETDAFERVIYTESHDEVANGRARVPEEIWPGKVDSWFSKKRSTLAAALVLTSPGIPMLFQGQELLEDRWFHDKDPIDWGRAEDESGILGMYRDLIALRRNLAGVSRGLCAQNVHIFHVDDEAKLIAFHRWDQESPKDSVVVVVNLTIESRDRYVIGFPRTGVWHTRFNSDSYNYGPDFENHATPNVETREEEADGLPCCGEICIGPYTVVIFSQDE